MDDPAAATTDKHRSSRFEFAPPRHFVLPAVLLLLSERPGYGYSLEKELQSFGFGKIDRPTVYRALAHLEDDALVDSRSEAAKVGQTRRVYRITPLGERVLRVWMSTIKRERDGLLRMLHRYQATGTLDAVLAEVEGAWTADLGFGWSPVSPTAPIGRRLAAVRPTVRTPATDGSTAQPAEDGPEPSPDPDPDLPTDDRAMEERLSRGPHRYRLVADRSVVLIEVRSTVGPISFGAIGIRGSVQVDVDDDGVRPGTQPSAHVEIDVDGLRSGNSLYDAELLRRIGARRFPVATLDLRDCVPIGDGGRCRLDGELTFHGVTRPAHGTVDVAVESPNQIVVTGEQVFDIRDFAVPSPTVLMLRIYPDVRVLLHVEAELDELDEVDEAIHQQGERS